MDFLKLPTDGQPPTWRSPWLQSSLLLDTPVGGSHLKCRITEPVHKFNYHAAGVKLGLENMPRPVLSLSALSPHTCTHIRWSYMHTWIWSLILTLSSCCQTRRTTDSPNKLNSFNVKLPSLVHPGHEGLHPPF